MDANAQPKPPGDAGPFSELDAADRAGVAARLRSLDMNTLFARAVVEQGAPGRAFAYPARAPRVVYVVHGYGMSLLCGSTGAASADERLLAHVVGRRRAAAEWLQVSPGSWADRVTTLSAPGPNAGPAPPLAERHTRVNFAFSPRAYRARRPPSSQLARQVARAERSAFAMPGSVVPSAFWSDADRFVGAGTGFVAVADGRPVSLAFSTFVLGSELEIGIETLEPYRGRGLAKLACAALIDDCLARGLEPVWACRLENTASHRLAESLGFVPARSLPYFRLPPRPANAAGPTPGNAPR